MWCLSQKDWGFLPLFKDFQPIVSSSTLEVIELLSSSSMSTCLIQYLPKTNKELPSQDLGHFLSTKWLWSFLIDADTKDPHDSKE